MWLGVDASRPNLGVDMDMEASTATLRLGMDASTTTLELGLDASSPSWAWTCPDPTWGWLGLGEDTSSPNPKLGLGASTPPWGLGMDASTQLGCGRGYIQPHLGMGVDTSRPNFGLGVDAPRLLIIIIMGSASARCPLPMACNPIKICADHFLPTSPSMPNAPQQKDNSIPHSLPLQLFVLRVGLLLYCSNLQCFISI
jgi:hypothetical protein